MQDARGLEVAAGSPAAVAALDHFRDQMLALGPDPLRVLADADENPGCGLLQAHAAALHLYGMTDEGDAAAAARLARARAATPAGEREELWYAALDRWLARDYERAMDGFEEITRRWPRDLLAAKMAEFHYYATGQHWQAPRFLAHMERIADVNQDSSHFLSMNAFALELSGRYAEAQSLAEHAIEMELVTPWAHHCLAHVLLRQGRFDEGESRVRELAPSWEKSGQPIHGHNAWHLALFALARLDLEETRRIYHAHVAGRLPETVGEQVDAISLLWRIELAGGDVGQEWAAIANHIEPRADQCFIPFVSAHDVYALVRADRTAAARRKIASCRKTRDRLWGERRRVWDRVGLPLVEACAAFASGDCLRAATLFEPIYEEIGCVGGSDAQDDLFRQTHLASLTRAGRTRSARALLDAQVDGRAPSPLESSWAATL